MGKRMSGDSSLVYVLTGDGELQEGQNWEAIIKCILGLMAVNCAQGFID